MSHKLAIDFGTTNSVVARWDDTSASGQTLELPPISTHTASQEFLIPTLLYVKDGRTGDLVLGQEVRHQGFDHKPGKRLFRNLKRTLGTGSVLDARIIDGVPWTDEMAGEKFLYHLLHSLPYRTDEIEELVLTVPVGAFEQYTNWLNRSLADIPTEKIQIIDEATAAALGYGISEPGATVLVIDFGGGTLDISLVRLPEIRADKKVKVIAKAGISLGGSDIDQWLMQEILQRKEISLQALGKQHPQLLSACEEAKIALSTSEETIIEFQIDSGESITEVITRPELEQLITDKGFYTAIKNVLEKLIGMAHQKGVYREDISHVLLVGGTSLIPSVQQTLDDFFRSITQRKRKAITQMPTWPATTWNIENTSIHASKPFTAVVEGALQITTGLGIDDQLATSYALQAVDRDGQVYFDEIIPRGSTYPSKQAIRVFLSASKRKQAFVELVIGQISTDAIAATTVSHEDGQKDTVSHKQKIALITGKKPLRIQLDPPGASGTKRLQADFRVDAKRQLHLALKDLKTRKNIYSGTFAAEPDQKKSEAGADKALRGYEPIIYRGKKKTLGQFFNRLASLINLRSPEKISVSAYAEALRSTDSMVRFNAADMLARRADRDARVAFEEVLKTGSPHQRASVVGHLYRFSWFSAAPLYHLALQDDDERVKEAAVFSLCKMRLPEAYALVINFLKKSKTEAFYSAAVWGLYSRPDPAAVSVLEATLRAENVETRSLALEVLGATESVDAIPIAKSALKDNHPDVVYSAMLSWIELARDTAFSEIATCIKETSGVKRQALLRGFFHATNYMGIEVGKDKDATALIYELSNALQDEHPETRLSAFLPLCWIRHPDADIALTEGFQHERNPEIKARMLTFAVHLMSPVALKLLEDSSQSPNTLLGKTAEHLMQHVKKDTQ